MLNESNIYSMILLIYYIQLKKIVAKMKNCSIIIGNFSFCHIIFNPNKSIYFRLEIFHILALDCFNVVCCRFVVCFKGFTTVILPFLCQSFDSIFQLFLKLDSTATLIYLICHILNRQQ